MLENFEAIKKHIAGKLVEVEWLTDEQKSTVLAKQ